MPANSHTPFGRMFLAAGTVGEVGPIVAMSLLLSQEYSTWQEFGFLLLFLAPGPGHGGRGAWACGRRRWWRC